MWKLNGYRTNGYRSDLDENEDGSLFCFYVQWLAQSILLLSIILESDDGNPVSELRTQPCHYSIDDVLVMSQRTNFSSAL